MMTAVNTMIGKNNKGHIIIYEYDKKGKRRDTAIMDKEPKFLRIGREVLICSETRSIIIDSDAVVCHGLDVYWKNEKNIGEELRRIMEENVIYDSELEPISERRK